MQHEHSLSKSKCTDQGVWLRQTRLGFARVRGIGDSMLCQQHAEAYASCLRQPADAARSVSGTTGDRFGFAKPLGE